MWLLGTYFSYVNNLKFKIHRCKVDFVILKLFLNIKEPIYFIYDDGV